MTGLDTHISTSGEVTVTKFGQQESPIVQGRRGTSLKVLMTSSPNGHVVSSNSEGTTVINKSGILKNLQT